MHQAQSVVAVYQQCVEVSDSEPTALTPVPPTSHVHLLVDVRIICRTKCEHYGSFTFAILHAIAIFFSVDGNRNHNPNRRNGCKPILEPNRVINRKLNAPLGCQNLQIQQ